MKNNIEPVLIVAPGVVVPGVKVWVFCIYWAKMGAEWVGYV